MRVNALVRVAVERWTQVTPKSVEVKMFPLVVVAAVWYWPVEDRDIGHQLKPVARDVHVTPKSDEVQILPASTVAV